MNSQPAGNAATSPEGLAEWVRARFPNAQKPPVNVIRIVEALGLTTRGTKDLAASGELRPVNDRLVVLYKEAQPATRRQFTIAHELGHYLLATIGQTPLEQQRADADVEHLCDQFASRLLLPRAWIVKEFSTSPVSFETVREVGRRAFVSHSAALSALNHYLRNWTAALLFWEWEASDRRWRLVSTVAPAQHRSQLDPGSSTAAWLEAHGESSLGHRARVPFDIAGTPTRVWTNLVRARSGLWMFIDLSSIGQ